MRAATHQASEKGGKTWMKAFGASDIGLRRKQNQDSYVIVESDEGSLLAVVCDGIGGGLAGDVASHMAVTHLKERFLQKRVFQDDIDVKHWLKETIQEANDLIFMQSTKSSEQKGMGTTCVGVIHTMNQTYIFNIGDSRIYGIYDHAFICLTEDHSFVQDLVKAGELTKEQAKYHPNRNMLTNALGIWDNVKIDMNKIKEGYDILLICSDGLHGYVSEEQIFQILTSQYDMRHRVYELIDASKNAGGYDNVSVIVLSGEDSSHE